MKWTELTAEETKIIVDKGTEPAFSGQYNELDENGLYICKRCGAPLFRSTDKFKSGTGWPSFDDTLDQSVKELPDDDRIEIQCANCEAHLGHVFVGEYMTDKNQRFCVNSLSLKFLDWDHLVSQAQSPESSLDLIVVAGGCFWGVEHFFTYEPGVLATAVGFSGGDVSYPQYDEVSQSTTGHAECVAVIFDSEKTTLETLYTLFFNIHDPTEKDQQGPDVGSQYRSAIFSLNSTQEQIAQMLIKQLQEKGYAVETTLEPYNQFWMADEMHQKYYLKNHKQPYCHIKEERL